MCLVITKRQEGIMQVITVNSTRRTELIDITPLVRKVVKESRVKNGICFIYVPHTTAGVTINEHADPDVARDIEDTLDRLIPRNKGYRHVEGNADSHIKSTIVGPEVFVFVENGDIVLGTWQGIFFCEFDGPRRRKVYIKVVEG